MRSRRPFTGPTTTVRIAGRSACRRTAASATMSPGLRRHAQRARTVCRPGRPKMLGHGTSGFTALIDLDGSRSISPGVEPSAATILPGPQPGGHGLVRLEAAVASGVAVVGRLPDRRRPTRSSPPWSLVAHHRAVPLSVDDGADRRPFPGWPRSGRSSVSERR